MVCLCLHPLTMSRIKSFWKLRGTWKVSPRSSASFLIAAHLSLDHTMSSRSCQIFLLLMLLYYIFQYIDYFKRMQRFILWVLLFLSMYIFLPGVKVSAKKCLNTIFAHVLTSVAQLWWEMIFNLKGLTTWPLLQESNSSAVVLETLWKSAAPLRDN